MSDIGYLPSESRNSHKRPYRHAYGVPLPPLRRGKLIVACPVFRARKKRAVVSRPLFPYLCYSRMIVGHFVRCTSGISTS